MKQQKKNNYISEEYFDSSVYEYDEEYLTPEYIKKSKWDIAIGLQEVDNLKPSKYLLELQDKNIDGKLSIDEVKDELKKYYSNQKSINESELECDFVSARIVELLSFNNFKLSVDYLKYIHKYLFQDVYEFAGSFREVNFSKRERILNDDSVAYGDYKSLNESLEYDIENEKELDYSKLGIRDVINNITSFSSRIWQVHPFREGNTRTTAVFIEKYLLDLGYSVDNTLFKDKSIYFRNALVRSNYFNTSKNIKADNSYLIKFYENLLLKKNNPLHSQDLIIEKLFDKKD